MASPNRTVLVRLMASMATGDPAALFPFIDEFGNELAGTVRRLLMSLNRPDVLRKNEDVDYLVQSAAFVLFDRSPSWDPAGALPWTWAERAIRAEIVRWLGHPAVEWDDRSHGEADVGLPVMVTPDLVDLAGDHVELAQLLSALTAVASERDAKVHLEYQAQKALGDRSPANTVGEMLGLSPSNIRQIDRRVRQRLSGLAESDPSFATLVRLSWVEAC